VIHLGGVNIASGRWSQRRKRLIRDSRVESTRLLAGALATLQRRPRVFLCASATGYYGDRGEMLLTEDSPPGSGFLAEACVEWEQAAEAARAAGIRVVHMRFGIVLAREGGALKKMLLPFRLGLGGPIGSGAQHWSWIALDDVCGVITHLLACDELAGPINVVAPQPVTVAAFTKTLGRVLRRPAVLRVPAFAVRLMLGEMADETLLASARVWPGRLLDSGYQFRWPDLEGALRQELGA
jgi:uncharacterized protein (TIGR01777 family)